MEWSKRLDVNDLGEIFIIVSMKMKLRLNWNISPSAFPRSLDRRWPVQNSLVKMECLAMDPKGSLMAFFDFYHLHNHKSTHWYPSFHSSFNGCIPKCTGNDCSFHLTINWILIENFHMIKMTHNFNIKRYIVIIESIIFRRDKNACNLMKLKM